MTEHFDEIFRAGRRPEGDRSVSVAQVQDSVEGILTYNVTRSKFSAVLGDNEACGGILVLEEASMTNGRFLKEIAGCLRFQQS